MNINKVQRPWYKDYQRKRTTSFYHTPEWRKLRLAFINSSSTLPDGRTVSNAICRMCYLEGRTEPVHTVDHIHRIRDGGDAYDMNNLQSLCRTHHDRKSSQEGHEAKRKANNGH
jgi:5-methylcytosine-specific restriction protein A